MYKFEIHKNPNYPITDSYTDTVRYDSDSYAFERLLNPRWSDLEFRWVVEDGKKFFRKTLSGSFTLVDTDFDWANEIRISDDRRPYRILIIKEKIENIWVEVWRGFFSVIVGTWDLSNCSVEFNDLLVWDEYNIILENAEKEKNLLEIPAAAITVYYKGNEYLYETYTNTTEFTITADGCWGGNLGFHAPTPSEEFITNNYTLVKKSVHFYKKVNNSVDPDDWNDTYYFSETFEYRRDYVIQVNNPGGWTDLGVYPDGSGNAEHKYVRNYRGLSSVSYEETYYNPYVYYWMDSLGAIQTCETYRNRDYNLIVDQDLNTGSNTRGRLFKDVVGFIVDEYGIASDYGFKSVFFNSLINPITGETNELRFLHIFQVTDLMDTSDPATKALYSFSDVENWIKMPNCYWYINDDGVIQFEHKKYFDYGLSYTQKEYEIDISGNNVNKIFSFNNKELPRIEKFEPKNVGLDDFWGVPMVYSSSMANWKDGNIVTYDFGIYTDMAYILEKQTDAGKDGFLMAAIELTDDGFYVIRDEGEITGINILNEPLSTSGIQEKYWKWGRPVSVGFMNNRSTEFDSVENNFIQEAVIVGYCDTFNPYKLVRTDYGDAKIESASLTLNDKKLTLTLSY